ncbi:hypothetical protein M378DRAFT_197301 [Amanita muscaria Koide BX008]|uniref:Uncharacterized protein n=1 Tax=Amanita muscaria (strain Koide BX008) TaxID=946122 RepID=A0A0C2STN1_AMAMK|nr:hypothetical protein M378DRAFT_197301 [Amanita muscaria Koide BX008]
MQYGTQDEGLHHNEGHLLVIGAAATAIKSLLQAATVQNTSAMERYEGDYPQQQQGQRGRQSDPSRMDPMMGQPGQPGQQGQGQQGQGQQGQWGQSQGQGQQGQWGQGQPQGPSTYGYGRDDDFSPPAEQGTGEGEYGTRSGSGATGARGTGAASDYDTTQYQPQQQQPQQQQMPQHGAGGEHHKPGIGQKIKGQAERAFGKMTGGEHEKAQKGQEPQSGQRY